MPPRITLTFKRSRKLRTISGVPSVELASATNTFVLDIFKSSCAVSEVSKRGISFASFLAGITIVNSFVVFMDAYPLFVDGQIRQAGIDPAACVVIVDAVALDVDGFMGVATKDAGRAVLVRVRQGSGRNFQRHPQP